MVVHINVYGLILLLLLLLFILLSDNTGRYAYSQQPSICRWNLQKLSEALSQGGLAPDAAEEGLDL